MNSRTCWLVVVVVCLSYQALAEEVRTWTDASGKFTIDAELVANDDGTLTLRKTDGKEIKVPLARLSDADRDYLGKSSGDEDSIREMTTRFYEDLRTTERTVAAEVLTADAKKIVEDGKSAIGKLPTPEEGDKSLRIGAPTIEGSVAEVPVRVRAGGKFHKTKLHFRKQDDEWRVFAISAQLGDDEITINFESAPRDPNEDPLKGLVGQPIEIVGITTDGDKLDWSSYRGKVVLIDFWATWCGPCRAEIPNILANYEEFHEDGFDVVAISVDQDLKELAQFVGDENPPWTVVADHHPKNKSSMSNKFGISGIPAFVLVDAEGKVAAVHCRGERLRTELVKLLGEPSESSLKE